MRRINFRFILLIISSLVFFNISVAAEVSDNILTLDEAKAMALKNNFQYGMQQHYIDQAKEKYQEAVDDSSGNTAGKKNISARASSEISEDMAVENAASGVRKAVFNKEDMKRSSDYNVTEAYCNAIKAGYSLKNAEADLERKKTDLETAKVKHSLSLITQSSLFTAESAYAASQISYGKAVSEHEISFMKLSKSIGVELDPSDCQLVMSFSAPDPKNLDMNKIKEGYLLNNSTYFNTKEQYKLAEYKLQLTQEKYDNYYDKMKNSSADVRQAFEDMLYDAQKSFNEADYTYKQKLSDLDTTLSNQYNSLVNLYESYMNQRKEYEDQKLKVEESSIKHQMGLISKSVFESARDELNRLEHQLNMTIMSLSLQYLNLSQYSL